MARATFYNKRLLGHIDDIDFTDYQGIGSDPQNVQTSVSIVQRFSFQSSLFP